MITGGGRLDGDLVVDGRLGEYSVIEAVSKISNFMITEGGRLGKDLVIDGILGNNPLL